MPPLRGAGDSGHASGTPHEDRSWSARHQRALIRYYLEAKAGGLAVGVHTTQFEIRNSKYGLFDALLEFCSAEIRGRTDPGKPFAMVSANCLDPHEILSPGQEAELDRVSRAYPDWQDTAFIAEHLESWLRP